MVNEFRFYMDWLELDTNKPRKQSQPCFSYIHWYSGGTDSGIRHEYHTDCDYCVCASGVAPKCSYYNRTGSIDFEHHFCIKQWF